LQGLLYARRSPTPERCLEGLAPRAGLTPRSEWTPLAVAPQPKPQPKPQPTPLPTPQPTRALEADAHVSDAGPRWPLSEAEAEVEAEVAAEVEAEVKAEMDMEILTETEAETEEEEEEDDDDEEEGDEIFIPYDPPTAADVAYETATVAEAEEAEEAEGGGSDLCSEDEEGWCCPSSEEDEVGPNPNLNPDLTLTLALALALALTLTLTLTQVGEASELVVPLQLVSTVLDDKLLDFVPNKQAKTEEEVLPGTRCALQR
jgi:hypothetical protein